MAEEKWYKENYRSLTGLLRANRRTEKELQKKRKSFKTAVITGSAVMTFFLVAMLISLRNTFSKQTLWAMAFFWILVVLIYVPLFAGIWYFQVRKPQKKYLKEVYADFPGIDMSSEKSIKDYLWNFKDRELLYNLAPLIVWEGAKRKADDRLDHYSFTPVERTVLNVWDTYSLDNELYSFYQYGQRELDYLERVAASFREIGAEEEGQLWEEARSLCERLEKLKYGADPDKASQPQVYLIDGDDGEVGFGCSDEDRALLDSLKKRIAELHEYSERKLYDYVMERKAEFRFSEDSVDYSGTYLEVPLR